MGLFSASTRFTQEMEEKGPGWGEGGLDWGAGEGGCFSALFTSPVNPHYPGPWSLASPAFRASAIEGVLADC